MSIITLGIYDIYWMFSTRYELIKKGLSVPTPWIIFAPLLGLLLVAVLQICRVALINDSGTTVATIINVISVLVGILAVLAIIPLAIYWTWKYSQAVEKVTKNALSAEVSFVIALITAFIGFWFIWPVVVQYYYNNISKPKDLIPDTPYPKI